MLGPVGGLTCSDRYRWSVVAFSERSRLVVFEAAMSLAGLVVAEVGIGVAA